MPEISHAIGLPAFVLRLQWPAGVEPAQLSNFETQARRLRYQALGNACRDKFVPYLLLAHHEDDQAESVLLRLVQGHNCMGLQGIHSLARMPECWGIHGVHQSGFRERNETMAAKDIFWRIRPGKQLDLLQELQEQPSSSMPFEPAMSFEDGGVTIHRPLLEFSKDRLIATCEALGVQWVEDETNRDPTKTPRNAIRYLLRDGRLPRSLQKPSLLALRHRMCVKAKGRIVRANKAFERCDISMLDTRIGGLVVRLPNRVAGTHAVPPAYRHKSVIDAEYQAALMLRQLLAIVSPQQEISLQSLEFAIDSIFPDIKTPTATNRDKLLLQLTAGGVSLQRVHSPWQRSDDKNALKLEALLDNEFVWALTRQPFANGENPTIQISPAKRYPIPESQPSSLLTQSVFQLWDSRYWIRVYNPTAFALRLQPLRPEHLRQLRSSLTVQESKPLDELLQIAAPGKVRFTLPVLLQERDGREEVVALPTLKWANPASGKGVQWEVRYKNVTLPQQTDVRRVII